MSSPSRPNKRPYEESPTEANERQKLAKTENQTSKCNRNNTVFRLLCLGSRTDSFFGNDGAVISQICQETGAEIKVEEVVVGCNERVVLISNSEKVVEATTNEGKEGGVETDVAEKGDEQTEVNKHDEDKGPSKHDEAEEPSKHDGDEASSKLDEDKEPDSMEDLKAEKNTSSAKKALLLIFERMVECGMETDGGNNESDKSSICAVRLLVFSSQMGCLMGEGGGVIKQMSSKSGAQIEILPRDKLPSCVLATDELVQISGETDAVRKALLYVSQLLLENPPWDQNTVSANSTGSPFKPFGHSPKAEVQSPVSHPLPSQDELFASGRHNGADYPSTVPSKNSRFHEGGVPSRNRMRPTEDILAFRLLCPEEKVGGVIGKGGTIVKSLQHETGCDINVLEGGLDGEERIIVISGPMHPDDRISPVQDAVLRVQARIFRALPESKEKSVTARLLVSSSQIGCLLGKGGSVIAEMRKSSGAHIRILGKDQVPKCASENEEVIQINGDFESIQEALFQITFRLLQRFFRDTYPSTNYPSNPGFQDNAPFPSYGRRRELSPPGMYSSYGPYHKFDAVGGPPPHGGFYPHEDHSPFMQNIHRLGVSPNILERNPSSAPWGSQGRIDGGGPMGFADYVGAPPRRIAGFGGGAQPAIITKTTVEVTVPRSVVPSIYGEDGGCLKQIRQISDAKITITDPKPGATETLIIISGTPEQYHAAQSLIQAFVMSEKESS